MEQEIKRLSMKNSYLIHQTNIRCVPSKLKGWLVAATVSNGLQNGVADKVTSKRDLREGHDNLEGVSRRQVSRFKGPEASVCFAILNRSTQRKV